MQYIRNENDERLFEVCYHSSSLHSSTYVEVFDEAARYKRFTQTDYLTHA